VRERYPFRPSIERFFGFRPPGVRLGHDSRRLTETTGGGGGTACILIKLSRRTVRLYAKIGRLSRKNGRIFDYQLFPVFFSAAYTDGAALEQRLSMVYPPNLRYIPYDAKCRPLRDRWKRIESNGNRTTSGSNTAGTNNENAQRYVRTEQSVALLANAYIVITDHETKANKKTLAVLSACIISNK